MGTACSQLPKVNSEKPISVHEDMLEDVLSVMPQVLDPRTNSVQFGPSEDKALNIIAARELAKAGYGIQRVSADQGVNYFSIENHENENGLISIRVSVGDIDISRMYETSKNNVRPAGPFELAGTRVKIDPTLSELGAGSKTDLIATNVEYTSIAPIDGGIPTISLLSNDVIQGVLSDATNAPGYKTINASKLEINNRFYDEAGAFATLLNQRERVARQIIIFPNDSMRLGEEGKKRIEQLLRRFSERRDLINVVGCSNGHTDLKIGNEGLALGRAKRITEELLALGVPSRNIFDDACWSPQSDEERFPNRGVVVDIMRSVS
jgi:outer membrane protein OmpA-like peptidoglycan-associated protein